MGELPTGTVTLLFSDIEGSTTLLSGLGPTAWGDVLQTHRRIMRAAFAEHGGLELGTEGDSFFVVFTSAHDAVLAAIMAQQGLVATQWPQGVALRVRMGLHTGEPQPGEEGYIGIDVHRAARIAATANGGQVVISETTRGLLAGLPDEPELVDLGWHRLKDLRHPEHLFEVVAPGMVTDHRPLRSLGTFANLPTYSTQLVGRDRELAEVIAAFDRGQPLVTLTGPGGAGKTRLAVAVAQQLQVKLGCDAFFVDLHAALGSTGMWAAIAEATGLPGGGERSPRAQALDFLSAQPVLLILDNLEQIPDADVVVADLLNVGPQVRVLATSRGPLHLVDEQQLPVRALAIPDPATVRAPGDAQVGAVELFVQRARLVRPGFALTQENVGDVVALCRRLDGLPLSIELAAGRLRLLSPSALLRRLDARLSEVSGAGRVERQRTLEATIGWSYDLLDAEDQAVFRRLGVFPGRFDLEAVAGVADNVDRDPLDVVAHLVDVSLAETGEGPDGEPLIWLLETIRLFARERLQDAGESEAARAQHALWCLASVTQANAQLGGPMRMSALDRFHALEPDIAAALDWTLGSSGSWTAERLVSGLSLLEQMYPYWYRFSHAAEGRRWHERALARLRTGEVADSARIVDALHGQGILALEEGDVGTGTQAIEQALAMAHRLGDGYREARESNSLGVARRLAGDLASAQSLLEQSLALARAEPAPRLQASALSNMVIVHLDSGRYAQAVEAAHAAMVLDRQHDDTWGLAVDWCNLVLAVLYASGPHAAMDQLREGAASAVALGDASLSIEVLEYLACVRAALGDGLPAATVMGSVQRHRRALHMHRAEPDQAHLDRFIEPVRASLDPEVWQRAFDAGAALSIEAALALGLSDAEQHKDSATASGLPRGARESAR